MKKKILTLLLCGFVSCFGIQMNVHAESQDAEVTTQATATSVSYRTHVQTYGWQNYVKDGAMSGTSGQSKRLEGINIKLDNQEYSGGIRYRTHVQTYGWQGYVKDGEMSGTSGQSKRLEAIQIELTGEMAKHYDVYYRVHCQTFGWMGWAKNGELSGTAGYAKRLEGIEIKLVKKGGSAPGSTANRYSHPLVEYRTHVQTYGWQGYVKDGEMSGTSGQAKRLEGINIKLNNPDYSGSIQYRTHVQTYGWQGYVKDGAMSGTSGESKRLEAIQINLTGEMANYYDVYYRVHCQTFGWMGWAKNGEMSGTAGYSKRLEGIEIKLVAKGGKAPGSTANAFKDKNHTHSYEVKEEVKATCTKDGYKKYVCKTCGNTYQETSKKLGHDFEKKIEHKDSTCKTKGYDLYQCTRCEQTHKKELALSTNHNYKFSKKVAATCTEDGYDLYKCTVCDATQKKVTEKKLGHSYTKKIGYKAPTCTEDGYTRYQCARCDATYDDSDLQWATGHKYTVKETKATCTTKGSQEYTCSVCGYKYQKEIAALGHSFDKQNPIERVEPSCKGDGYVKYKCTRCGDTTTEVLKGTGEHNYVKTSEDLQYVTYTCSGCGDVKTEFNDKTYTIDLGNGQTTTVVGHFDLEMRKQIYDLVRERRAKFGSNPIKLAADDSPLQDVANIRAYEITNSYSHTRPNGERAILSFYNYANTEGENLARGQRSAEEVCTAWFQSSTHNANILSNNYASIGIGVFCLKYSNGYTYYFSQMFSSTEY